MGSRDVLDRSLTVVVVVSKSRRMLFVTAAVAAQLPSFIPDPIVLRTYICMCVFMCDSF